MKNITEKLETASTLICVGTIAFFMFHTVDIIAYGII